MPGDPAAHITKLRGLILLQEHEHTHILCLSPPEGKKLNETELNYPFILLTCFWVFLPCGTHLLVSHASTLTHKQVLKLLCTSTFTVSAGQQ